jgi:hypothetical protein
MVSQSHKKASGCEVCAMWCPHTVEMMVLSSATKNVLRRTETIRRTVLAVDCFGW